MWNNSHSNKRNEWFDDPYLGRGGTCQHKHHCICSVNCHSAPHPVQPKKKKGKCICKKLLREEKASVLERHYTAFGTYDHLENMRNVLNTVNGCG